MRRSFDFDDARVLRTISRAVQESSTVIIHLSSFATVFHATNEFTKLDLPFTCLTVPGVCPAEAVQGFRELLSVGFMLSKRGIGWQQPLQEWSTALPMLFPSALMLIGNVTIYLWALKALTRQGTKNGQPARLSDMDTCFQVQRLLQRRGGRIVRAFHITVLLALLGYAFAFLSSRDVEPGSFYQCRDVGGAV